MKFFVVGMVCLVVSMYFGFQTTIDVQASTNDGIATYSEIQNTTAAAASAGLAIAGGLSLIVADIDKKNRESGSAL